MSTKCLNCDNSKDFFETVLHVPVMCGRQLNSSSVVPVLMNLFNMTVFNTKIKVKRAKLMFLPSSK